MTDPNDIFGFEKAEDSSGFLLWKISTLWQRRIRAALDPLGLTHSQFVLLAVLHHLAQRFPDEPVTQVRLSTQTGIDVMTVSTVLRTLEGRSLVSRRAHPTDTRAKVLVLEPAALPLLAQAVKAVEATDAEFFRVLGDREREFVEIAQRLMQEGH
ncbi:MarR family transcriptional regulator [Nostoc sp. NIES-2111]